jgi:hypothetical protein
MTNLRSFAGERLESRARKADTSPPSWLSRLTDQKVEIQLLGRMDHSIHAEPFTHRLAPS